ncbi:NAD-dependent epimerase/dehydratase family protein, partial [Klebsiella pneumoniae]|uniref:NAD-dependent epimerase/dehydratase family protein n=1 Tax=Klebsiella pneumoniae TaxID=573 RepID=UPI003FD11DB3
MTGGTGTIGTALTKELIARGFQVMIVSRSKKESGIGVSYYTWNIDRMEIENEAIQKADFIIHLAGAGVADKRWTAGRKKEIL